MQKVMNKTGINLYYNSHYSNSSSCTCTDRPISLFVVYRQIIGYPESAKLDSKHA